MNKKLNWKIIAGLIMIILSTVFYFLHYLIFKDAHHIFIYLLGDIAFVFIEVLMVSLIIHHLLNEWDKKNHLKKLNMVIETFFSEFGKTLLAYLSNYDRNLNQIHGSIISNRNECDLNFKEAFKKIKNYKPDIDTNKIDFSKIKHFLIKNRSFLINLLQNPSLLEHETFTETLMSIFHLAEELAARDINSLSNKDIIHTKEDFERAYSNLIYQWLSYMNYTKTHYPYFFLFAMETNPFDEKAVWFDKCYSEIIQK